MHLDKQKEKTGGKYDFKIDKTESNTLTSVLIIQYVAVTCLTVSVEEYSHQGYMSVEASTGLEGLIAVAT